MSQPLLLARAALVLGCVKVCLRVAPVWTIRRASRHAPAARADAADVTARMTRAVETLGAVTLLMSDCLSRSIAVLVLARLSGVSPTLVIGARRVEKRLDAHAWLECAGVPVPDQDTGQYVRLWAPR